MLSDVVFGGFVSILGAPHGYHPLSGFVVLERVEARFIKIENFLWSYQLLQSKEIKNILCK